MKLDVASSTELAQVLDSGERLLWSGRPRQGIVIRSSEIFMTPFALLWGGFAFFWEWQVLQSGAPLFLTIWGIPFVLTGVYLIVGRFFVEAKQRERTHYGITNERVLILSGLFTRKVKSLSLRGLSELSLVEGANGEGSISFGSTPFPWAPAGWPGMDAYTTPRFDLIEDAKNVYDIIRAAQRAAT